MCRNEAIRRERHILPTIDDILSDVANSKVFSVLDLNQAYHQIELHEDSRYITTFSTHVGLRRYKRLFFGVTSAAEIFHNIVRELLSGIPGVVNAADDILIHGPNEKEHDKRYDEVVRRLKSKRLTINMRKKKYKQSKVRFYGLIVGANGVEVDPDKVSAVKNFPKPTSTTEVRSFLGMSNWCSRFIKNHADLSEPLRRLTSKTLTPKFQWNQKCEKAFQEIKEALSTTEKLSFFDTRLKTELIVDASPTGLGAILSQVNTKGHRQIVAFASKALNKTQQHYSQTEREALAIIWGCEHFRIYLLGSRFTVITDHKPLVTIFNKPTAVLSARLERWMLRKQPFEFDVIYQPGSENAADFLSRHPQVNGDCKQSTVSDEYVRYVCCQSVPETLTLAEIAKETANDVDLQCVTEAISSGKWHPLSSETIRSFHKIREELTLTDESVILRGTRICIPAKLQQRVLKQAHDGHMGISKTKALLRTRVWFPNMDNAVETMIKDCLPCQASSKTVQRDPLIMSNLPDLPWQQLSMDFCHLPSGEELLVVIDDFSRFPEVEIVPTTSHKHVIPKLEKILSTFGIPEIIRTDNGPPFNGQEFHDFSKRF